MAGQVTRSAVQISLIALVARQLYGQELAPPGVNPGGTLPAKVKVSTRTIGIDGTPPGEESRREENNGEFRHHSP